MSIKSGVAATGRQTEAPPANESLNFKVDPAFRLTLQEKRIILIGGLYD
jgi:hypothetical protein